MKKRMAIYYRVSTQKQKGNLRSEFNIEAGKQYAEKHGYEYTLFDETESGKSFERPEWNNCYDQLVSGKFDALWISEIDRLGRNDVETPMIYAFLETQEISLIVGNRLYDYDNPDDEFIFKIGSLLAHTERKKIVKRTREGKAKEIDAGKRRFCFVYGYDQKMVEAERKWFPVPEQIEIIKKIYSLFLDKGYGLADICKYLNDRALKPLKADQWERTGIKNILKRIEYTGKTYNKAGEIINHYYYTEKIISLEDWKRVQKRFKNQITDNTRRGRNASYPASNIIKCAKCGKGFYYHEGKRTLADGTQKWIRRYAHKFDLKSVQARKNSRASCSQAPKYIDFYLLNLLCHEVFSKEMNSGIENLSKIVENLKLKLDDKKTELLATKERLEIRIDESKVKIQRLSKIAEKTDNLESIIDRLNELSIQDTNMRKELSKINIALNDDQERVEKLLADFSYEKKIEYELGTPKEKRELLKNILDSCTLDGLELQFTFITGNQYKFNIKDERDKRWNILKTNIYEDSYEKYSKNNKLINSEELTMPLKEIDNEIKEIVKKSTLIDHKQLYDDEYEGGN